MSRKCNKKISGFYHLFFYYTKVFFIFSISDSRVASSLALVHSTLNIFGLFTPIKAKACFIFASKVSICSQAVSAYTQPFAVTI